MLATYRSNPESILENEQARRQVRFEVQGLPLVEGFVIRNLYGIGCETKAHIDLASILGMPLSVVTSIESSALNRLYQAISRS